ncbi:energy-coupled thiamine transporter ThiT [Halothermothrix orenii]|uniref:Putative proton-coupled thiamine transporter YuaJ n=1 Tax=Halothermothrix orenii (strain H 168 / OCM 544 / DSM 9562) TaxID=373903 RepID=B8CWU0_HALOH|nr:energy-coupled thiamine transporter ThiT [Halothermothrix orenii]ACL69759.1 putative proton-coupled thiamine transporter YuaJ [Halothermothrix orenii H 168]
MRENRTRLIVEAGMAVALSAVFNLIPLWRMPQGGSISLEMLPVLIIAFRWGGTPGLITGFVYGLVQLAIDPHIYYPLQVILDYPLAYMLVGIAGYIPVKNTGSKIPFIRIIGASLLGGLLRLFCHVLSGVLFFSQYAPEGQNVWVYSTVYNGTYLIPALLLSMVLIIPLYRKLILYNNENI